MGISDEAFREAFKPLPVPAHFKDCNSDQEKIIFALAQLEEGSADEVNDKLAELDPRTDARKYKTTTQAILTGLFKKGLIAGSELNGQPSYNLHKITKANDGAINPELLAPGLD